MDKLNVGDLFILVSLVFLVFVSALIVFLLITRIVTSSERVMIKKLHDEFGQDAALIFKNAVIELREKSTIAGAKIDGLVKQSGFGVYLMDGVGRVLWCSENVPQMLELDDVKGYNWANGSTNTLMLIERAKYSTENGIIFNTVIEHSEQKQFKTEAFPIDLHSGVIRYVGFIKPL